MPPPQCLGDDEPAILAALLRVAPRIRRDIVPDPSPLALRTSAALARAPLRRSGRVAQHAVALLGGFGEHLFFILRKLRAGGRGGIAFTAARLPTLAPPASRLTPLPQSVASLAPIPPCRRPPRLLRHPGPIPPISHYAALRKPTPAIPLPPEPCFPRRGGGELVRGSCMARSTLGPSPCTSRSLPRRAARRDAEEPGGPDRAS